MKCCAAKVSLREDDKEEDVRGNAATPRPPYNRTSSHGSVVKQLPDGPACSCFDPSVWAACYVLTLMSIHAMSSVGCGLCALCFNLRVHAMTARLCSSLRSELPYHINELVRFKAQGFIIHWRAWWDGLRSRSWSASKSSVSVNSCQKKGSLLGFKADTIIIPHPANGRVREASEKIEKGGGESHSTRFVFFLVLWGGTCNLASETGCA